MVGYVTENDECRSRYLLRYFGQEDSSDCLTCDLCRAKRKAAPSSVERRIREYMKEHPEAGLMEVKAWIDSPESGLSQNAIEIYRNIVGNEY